MIKGITVENIVKSVQFDESCFIVVSNVIKVVVLGDMRSGACLQ